jgi:hypothetical protein
MTLLLSTYRHQEKWDEAHSLLIEKIAVESRGSSKANQGVLADMLILVEILLKKCAYAEALLYGRRALKSYRKLGLEGNIGVQDSLKLLCQVCNAAGNHDEEDAYSAILSDVLQQPVQAAKSNTITVSAGHDAEPTASPTASAIERERSVENPSTKNLSSPDAAESNNSWLSSGPLTPTSSRTHHRGSSLSFFGSAGPASPHTTNTSFSAASRENLSALKDTSIPPPTDTSVSQSPPQKPMHLEDTTEKLKASNDSQALTTSKSTTSVALTPTSYQMNDTHHPQEAVAMDGASSGPSLPSNIPKHSKSRLYHPMANHTQMSLEASAIAYFRAKKGNPPKPVIPTPRTPMPVSDYELPQWLGTHPDFPFFGQLDPGPAELPAVSLEPLKKALQKSKSAMDLFDLGVVELPAGSLQTSKSTVNLQNSDAIFAGRDGPGPAGKIFAVNDKLDRDAIFAPLDKHVPAGTSAGNKAEPPKSLSNGTASSAAPSRPEIGRALNDMDKWDKPILKFLIEMGYPRTEAQAALERYDYNLERVSLRICTWFRVLVN